MRRGVRMRRTVKDRGHISCTIEFPGSQMMTAEQAFIWYAFSLGFAIPVAAISVFYLLVVIRLGQAGSLQQTKGNEKFLRKTPNVLFYRAANNVFDNLAELPPNTSLQKY